MKENDNTKKGLALDEAILVKGKDLHLYENDGTLTDDEIMEGDIYEEDE